MAQECMINLVLCLAFFYKYRLQDLCKYFIEVYYKFCKYVY